MTPQTARAVYDIVEQLRRRIMEHHWTRARTLAEQQALEAELYDTEEWLLDEARP